MTKTIEKTITFSYRNLQLPDHLIVNKNQLFYVNTSYDGYWQTWLIRYEEETGEFIHVATCFESDLDPEQPYKWSFEERNRFISADDASRQIPGAVRPVVEGVEIPETKIDPRHRDIKSYRQTKTWRGGTIDRPIADCCLYDFYNEELEGFVGFSYDDVMNDLKQWFSLSDEETYDIWNYSRLATCEGQSYWLSSLPFEKPDW